MSYHHKYLAKKSYHPLNEDNQAKVAEAEAIQASLQRRVEERLKKLERERAQQVNQSLLEKHVTGISGKETSVAFLYQPPPGFVPALAPPAASTSTVKEEDTKVEVDLTHDSLSSASVGPASAAALAALPHNAPPPAPGQAVESWEERRSRHRTMTPQQIREELHPALKGAPVKGEHVRAAGFIAKPLGVVLRDTRCVRCGGIGHASSDRECPRFNERGVGDDSTRQREDPLTKLRASGAADAIAGGKQGQFRLMYNDEAYTVGGLSSDDPLHQVIMDQPQDEENAHRRKRLKSESGETSAAAFASSELDPTEQAFLASLSSEDMKLLLKQLKKSRQSDDPKSERKKKKDRKHRSRHKSPSSPSRKHRKRKHRSSSSSSSSNESEPENSTESIRNRPTTVETDLAPRHVASIPTAMHMDAASSSVPVSMSADLDDLPPLVH